VSTIEELLDRKVAAPVKKTKTTAVGIRHADHVTPLLANIALTSLGYRSGGPGSIPGTIRKKVVGLERGPLNLVSTTEELLD
jgi:hypothetical protein